MVARRYFDDMPLRILSRFAREQGEEASEQEGGQ